MSQKEDARLREFQRDYASQLEALDAERYEAQMRLAQVLGWGDFRECSPAQTEQFAVWAQAIGLNHLGNPPIRLELFAEKDVTDRLLRGTLRWFLVGRHDLHPAARNTIYNVAREFGYCVCPRCDDGVYNGEKCSLCDGIGWLNEEGDPLD